MGRGDAPLDSVADGANCRRSTRTRWELYNVAEDFSQANDLAAQNPAKLKELQDLFVKEAIRNHVFPLDDRRVERFNAAIAGRPDLIGTARRSRCTRA